MQATCRVPGLQVPKCIKDNTESYRNDQNVLGQFLEERCQQSPELTVSKRDLYDDYHLWAERSGEYVMGKVEFRRPAGTLYRHA